MRKLLGGVVLVAGVIGTGWYGTAYNAKTMQRVVTAAAEDAAQETIHPVTTRVSGRDITVAGIANDEAERSQILAAMNDLAGRRVVRDTLRVLEKGSPFLFAATKDSDGVTHSGMVPTEADRVVLTDRIGADAENLSLMSGAPDANWTGVVEQGLNSLDALQGGTLSLSDNLITVSGDALIPDHDAAARTALAELPEGYAASFDINLLDDGTPFRLTIDQSEDGAVTSTGKIPSTLDVTDLSAALGTDLGTGVAQSILPPALTNWPDVSKTGASALAALRSGQMQMTEDRLTVTGVATPDGKATAEALLAALPDGFTATADIALYDDGAPFSLDMTSDANGTSARGKFPAEVTASDVIGNVPITDIRNAFINDDTAGFSTVATGGVQALAQLEEGQLNVVGTEVTLSGVARTPSEASAAMNLLGDLPDGYSANFEIDTIDDGTPPNFDVTYTAADGASVAGKLPAGTEVADIAAALGLGAVTGDPVKGLVGDGTFATEKLAAVSNWLPEMDTMAFNSNDDAISVKAVAAPGVNQSLVQAGLAEALGTDATISVTAATDLPAEGTIRTNQATGLAEILTAGFWLPVLDFASDPGSCNAQSAEALQANRIGFVTGSADLDAQSVRAINAVAAIVRKCLSDTDLNVEIGGHTDSQGRDIWNLELSRARAGAVRTALIARGAAESDIIAKGYGEAEPIADNETEEGRAANRRTTLRWFTPLVEDRALEPEDTGADDASADTETNTEVGE